MEEGLEGLALRRTRAVLRPHPVDHLAVSAGGAGMERAEGRVGEQTGGEGGVEGAIGIVRVGAGGEAEAGKVEAAGSPDVASGSRRSRRGGPIAGQVRGPGTKGRTGSDLMTMSSSSTVGASPVRWSLIPLLLLVVGAGIMGGGIVAVLLVVVVVVVAASSSLLCRLLGLGGIAALLRLVAVLLGQGRGRRLDGRRLGVAAALPAGGDDVLPPLALGAVQARADGPVLAVVVVGGGLASIAAILPPPLLLLLLLLVVCRRRHRVGIHVELGPEEGGDLGRGAAAGTAEAVDLGGAGRVTAVVGR